MVLPYIKMNPPQVYMCSPSWTLLHPPSPYHPSGSSQCTSPKHPVSCIEPGLATRFIYDIIHVSMPFSQIISPSLSPTESKRLFYTSVSLDWILEASQLISQMRILKRYILFNQFIPNYLRVSHSTMPQTPGFLTLGTVLWSPSALQAFRQVKVKHSWLLWHLFGVRR